MRRAHLLTVSEAAERLGLKEGTLRHWLRKRRLEKVQVGTRGVRIPEDVIEALIRKGTIRALDGSDDSLVAPVTRNDTRG